MTTSPVLEQPQLPNTIENSKPFGKELIIITRPDAGLRAGPPGSEARSIADADVADLNLILKRSSASLHPLFGKSEEAVAKKMADLPPGALRGVPGLENYYALSAPNSELEELAENLRELSFVDAAYIKPPGEPPIGTPVKLNSMVPLQDGPPVAGTPNFVGRQDYLGPAPVGVDAKHGWTLPGGRGKGVKIIDCEWGWNFSHEDLRINSSGLVFGTNHSETDHGTAVIGTIGGDENSFGIVGICPDAQIGAASFAGQHTARTIRSAADKLGPGDILLLEIHRPGPRATGAGQKGYIGVEWWPDDFAAIRYAISRGIVVVEAAGNGWEDLDDPIYDAGPGFPPGWTNPFNPANASSDAVLVGAGSPPLGTHGRTISPWGLPYVDRARCEFSNWGSRVDVQGWGWEVTSTGYGDLQGGDLRQYYTDQFSGTSSASPIVTGVIACLQGILMARNQAPLTSAQSIALLRSSGSAQQDAPGRPATQRIGSRPNLRELLAQIAPALG